MVLQHPDVHLLPRVLSRAEPSLFQLLAEVWIHCFGKERFFFPTMYLPEIIYKDFQSSYPHRFSIGLKQSKKQHSKVSGNEGSVLC